MAHDRRARRPPHGGGARTRDGDDGSRARLRARRHTGDGGAFALDVPTSVVEWYAAIDPGRSSGLASFVPGTAHDLLLDVSPGGDLHVTIVDADTRKPLTARLLVHGIEGTVDPSFGPDYRASGAGPLIDALRGDVMTPLPSGHYRVAATKGIEWTIDARVVDIAPGRVTDVELAPRHVVPTPGVLGCDLHVHARPSFDAPVTPEDRVLSLAAAGIDEYVLDYLPRLPAATVCARTGDAPRGRGGGGDWRAARTGRVYEPCARCRAGRYRCALSCQSANPCPFWSGASQDRAPSAHSSSRAVRQ